TRPPTVASITSAVPEMSLGLSTAAPRRQPGPASIGPAPPPPPAPPAPELALVLDVVLLAAVLLAVVLVAVVLVAVVALEVAVALLAVELAVDELAVAPPPEPVAMLGMHSGCVDDWPAGGQ